MPGITSNGERGENAFVGYGTSIPAKKALFLKKNPEVGMELQNYEDEAPDQMKKWYLGTILEEKCNIMLYFT